MGGGKSLKKFELTGFQRDKISDYDLKSPELFLTDQKRLVHLINGLKMI